MQRQQAYLIRSTWCHGRSSWKPLCSLSYISNLGAVLFGDTLCDTSEPVIERHHGTHNDNGNGDSPIDCATVVRWQRCTRSTTSKTQAEAVHAPPILHHWGLVDITGRLVLLFRCQWPVN